MTNKIILAFTLALLSSAPAAFAQDAPAGFDSRWTPYLGCWNISQEQQGQFPVALAPGTMVCVRPSGRAGVAITTTVDGKTVLEQTVVADGSAQPLTQGDCRGTQTSEWSRDGERLFTRVALDCTGRPTRNVTGITMMAKGQWIDVQATVVDNDHDLRVRRYRRTSDQYTGARSLTSSPFNVEDVIEASAKVDSPAVEAALVEAGGRFTLNSRVLEQLADAKVSPNVIDLMVAQAYPDRFEIDRGVYPPVPAPVASTASMSSGGNTTVMLGSNVYPYPYYDPFYSSYYYYSPFAYPYYWGPSYRYRVGYPYYYGGYNYYGYPGYYYGGGSINPGGGRNAAPPGSPDSRGGSGIATSRGYTRVRPAGSGDSGSSGSATPSNRSGSVGGRGFRGTDSGSSSSSSGSSGSSSSSGSSGASSGGYSSGGGGGSVGGGGGGRTAQPR
jgi:hypothetical protein